jgi:autotransporter translocation and assembly factor TamB
VAAKELGVIGGGKVYKADFSGTLLMFFPGNPTCPRNEDQSGTVTIELSEDTSAVRGTAKVDGDLTYNGQPCAFGSIGPRPGGRDSFGTDGDATVGGTAGALTFDARQSNNFTESNGASGVNSYIFTFTGALNGSEITGTLTIRREIGGPIGTAGNGVGTIAYNVTLR